MQNIIEEKRAYLRKEIASAELALAELNKQEKHISEHKGIEKWLGNSFESSSGLTPEFAEFAQDYKRELKKQVSKEFETISINRGHFYLSGFLKNKQNEKYVYFSTSDVRHFPDSWYHNILIRTAKHNKDYSGGANNYTNFPNLLSAAINLTR